MGFENVGKVWTPSELATYLGTIEKPAWCRAITLHHTGVPALADRPNGFTKTSIQGIQGYYQRDLKWSSGPHLFVDDDQCWGMCDFREFGIHAKSFNSMSLGIEVLGNYNYGKDDKGRPTDVHTSGRGLACWTTAAAATKALLAWLGLEADQVNLKFHRDDPKTTKTCPGERIEKYWFIDLIKAAGQQPRPRAHRAHYSIAV